MVTPQSEQQGKPDDATTRALGFERLVGGRVQAYELMLATDLIFREDPAEGAQAGDQFRLWSQLRITGKCEGGKIVQWTVADPEVAVGNRSYARCQG